MVRPEVDEEDEEVEGFVVPEVEPVLSLNS